MYISRAINQFTDDPVNEFRPSTRKAYRAVLRKMVDTIGDRPLEQVTAVHLLDAVHARHPSPATVRNRITAIKSLFEWAEYNGHTKDNVTRLLPRNLGGNDPVVEHTWLSREDMNLLMDALPDETDYDRRNRIIFQIGFTTGLRRSEIASLKWGQIDWRKSQISIVGKGGKLAKVFMPDSTKGMLASWRGLALSAASPLDRDELAVIPTISYRGLGEERTMFINWEQSVTPTTVSNVVRKSSEAVGMKIAAHDMRRTFAGIVHEQAGIEATSAALRHASLGTTQIYLERRQDAAYQAVKGAGIAF